MLTVAALAVSLIGVGGKIGAAPKPSETTLCRVLAEPKRYESRRIVMSGQVMGGIHGMIVVDPNCPDAAMDLLIDNVILHRNDVWPLFSAIYRGENTAELKRIDVKIAATFHYAGTKTKRSSVELKRVLDLKIAKP